MNIILKPGVSRAIVLDISGIYSKIYNEGYYLDDEIEELENTYKDKNHWYVLVL